MRCKEITFYLKIPQLEKLNCAAVDTLTCTVNTYAQYNPLNKHLSQGYKKQKSQRFICKNNSPSSYNYYHLCI